MNEKQKSELLKVAKASVRSAVNHEPIAEPESDSIELNRHCGCFVTLKNGPNLRGCLGQFTSDKPLIKLIAEMAASSATRDPRFVMDPITPGELEFLEIEISALSPLKKIQDPMTIRLGIDGVYITDGVKSGCFLPQVALETGWTEEQFLTHCCVQKAKLPPDAWKNPKTEVYFFTAEVFGARFTDI